MISINNLFIQNAGPIEEIEIKFENSSAELKKPVILVGENGSGKTTALSFIADSLLELFSREFNDVLEHENSGRKYYRIRSNDIRVGSNSSIAHIQYEINGNIAHYIDRISNVEVKVEDLRSTRNLPADFPFNGGVKAEKSWSGGLDNIQEDAVSGAYLFFPNGRREDPHWLQPDALHTEKFNIKQKFNKTLAKKVVVERAAEQTSIWIMDSLLDQYLGYSVIGFKAANQILSVILDDPNVHFAIAPRNIWPRIQIYSGVGNDRKLIIPSLAHLSAGQSMLLSMFATIANHGTLAKMKPLDEIEGIVVIDEAEIYLHTFTQRVALPKLIKLFPKVQFIISSHSPSFLIGMKEQFGSSEINIVDMPSGSIIDVNQFREVDAAIDTLRNTFAFKKEVLAEIENTSDQPLLIVEGRSDAILIKQLWKLYKSEDPPFRILSANNRRHLRYLLDDDGFIKETPQSQKVLAIFDFDEAYDDWNGCRNKYPDVTGTDESGLLRKHTEKQIYTALLPVPPHRRTQAGLRFGAQSRHTIELYLSDEELKRTNNLAQSVSLGDVGVTSFCGDKVAFAERVSVQASMICHFQALLDLIQTTFEL